MKIYTNLKYIIIDNIINTINQNNISIDDIIKRYIHKYNSEFSNIHKLSYINNYNKCSNYIYLEKKLEEHKTTILYDFNIIDDYINNI